MNRGHAVYRDRRRRPGPLPIMIVLPWGRYERSAHLFWRVRILLYLGLAAAGWFVLRGRGAVAGFLLAALIEARFSYHKRVAQGAAPIAIDADDALRQAHQQAVLRWQAAQPSPAGWQPPPGARPAWNWTPPGGLQPRFDRVPRWVHWWYRTPFVDRFAHSWMWHHGGWDVLPAPHSDSE